MAEKVATVAGIKMDAIQKLEDVSQQYGLLNITTQGQFEQAFRLSEGIKQLTLLIDEEMMKRIMFLQDSKMGFRTDKQKDGGYDVKVVKGCFIEATLRGLRPIGNEWNIIAGNLYITKEGYTRILRDMPGMTDLKYKIGVPRLEEKKTVVDCEATWNFNGNADALKCTIPLITNAYTSVDAMIGKTERKLRYRIHCQITGSVGTDFDERDETEMNTNAPKTLAIASVIDAAKKANAKSDPKVVDVKGEPK